MLAQYAGIANNRLMSDRQTRVPLSLAGDGAERRHAAALDQVEPLRAVLDLLAADQPGIRIQGLPALGSLLATDGPIGAVAAEFLGRDCRPVRALLFDKTPAANWALGWHQDRTICVKDRKEAAGFGPWTVKAGMLHVAPPFDFLTRMVTLRVHLDDVPATNAPLLIAPGSHRRGRVAVGDIKRIVAECGVEVCLAGAGDVWVYATPILHASSRSSALTQRRVLQIDYSADRLPYGLEWQGI